MYLFNHLDLYLLCGNRKIKMSVNLFDELCTIKIILKNINDRKIHKKYKKVNTELCV